MKKMYLIVTVLVALTLLVSACSPQATPAPTAAPLPTSEPTMAAGAAAMVNVGNDAKLGSFLMDDKGMSLYLYTKDTPNTSACYDKCATAWPPLLTTGAPMGGTGVDATKLGTTTRTDGSVQVTYNGWPLYYFVKDVKPGDITGQNVGSVWFVVSPAGDKVDLSGAQATPTATVAAPSTGSAASVMVGTDATLGSFLVDAKGMTLYLYTKDTPNTSVCYGGCATAWPPLLTTGSPVAGTGVDATKLGTTTRTDGSIQVTYNGWPLYYYNKDMKAGDVTGQNVGSVWYVISPAGDKIAK